MLNQNNQEFVCLYTDGACSPNPGPGGWAVVASYGPHYAEEPGFAYNTTNQRMELQAAINGLRVVPRGHVVRVFSDSQYVVKGMTDRVRSRRLQGDDLRNKDLWDRLDAAAARQERVEWCWVRGHSGDPGNERADRLAKEAVQFAWSR